MTLYDLIKMDLLPVPKYETGISFIDKPFKGGLALGQLITITGDAEAGKTMLLNQLVGNVSKGYKCLYFSLEFNKRQLRENFLQRIKSGVLSEESIKNVEVIVTDTKEYDNMKNIEIGELYTMLHIMRDQISKGIKFIAIDSTLEFYVNELKGEEETTTIFRELALIAKKNDVLLITISQGSKEDNKERRIAIAGSQKASHYTTSMLHIFYDKESDKREFVVSKNKQEGGYYKQRVYLNSNTFMFSEFPVEYESVESVGVDIDKFFTNDAFDITFEKKAEPTKKEISELDELKGGGFNFG